MTKCTEVHTRIPKNKTRKWTTVADPLLRNKGKCNNTAAAEQDLKREGLAERSHRGEIVRHLY